MPTEKTSFQNTTPAGDSSTTNEMVIGKINTYQRTFLIVAGSLLALLVLIAVAGISGGQHLKSSVHEIVQGFVELADYQEDSTNLALTKDIFGLDAVSENDEGHCDPSNIGIYDDPVCCACCGCCLYGSCTGCDACCYGSGPSCL